MRRKDIDILKALAIGAVILYHFGFSKYGYLGVDLFFVINGFLITSSLIRNVENGTLSYGDFLVKRFCRLYPLVILAGLVSMLVGAISMLPDNYENLSMSVISSSVFANNVLSAITTKNYWDVVNNYKPLMHTWYLGILAGFYFVYPLLFIVPFKIFKKRDKAVVLKRVFWLILVCSVISFALYLLPSVSYYSKFYYLPFRFYELSFGGIVAFIYKSKKNGKVNNIINGLSVLAITVLMFVNTGFMPDSLRLVLVVGLSCLACATYSGSSETKSIYDLIPFAANLGKKSYSYFIWHQVILAFWRCYIGSEFSVGATLICAALIVALSEASYYLVEKRTKATKRSLAVCLICAVVLCIGSGIVYLRAGVIRDVPELGISADQIERQMHASYCDRVYGYDKEFTNDQKNKVLVIGNSFARDFANILLESSYADDLDISYTFHYDDEYRDRLLQSDYIFLYSQDDADYILLSQIVDKEKIWVIGTKNFGESNDMIYIRRFQDDYFDSTVKPDEDTVLLDQHFKDLYGNHYIDMMSPVMNDNDEVRVFTYDNKFISQDCRHLTQYGAKFYADILDLDAIFVQTD